MPIFSAIASALHEEPEQKIPKVSLGPVGSETAAGLAKSFSQPFGSLGGNLMQGSPGSLRDKIAGMGGQLQQIRQMQQSVPMQGAARGAMGQDPNNYGFNPKAIP